MAPKKPSAPSKSKTILRKEFRKKHYTSLRTESRVLKAHTNTYISKKAAAIVQSFLNKAVEEMLQTQAAAAGSKRVKANVAIACNNSLPYDVPKITVVSSFLTADKPVLLHPLAAQLENHN